MQLPKFSTTATPATSSKTSAEVDRGALVLFSDDACNHPAHIAYSTDPKKLELYAQRQLETLKATEVGTSIKFSLECIKVKGSTNNSIKSLQLMDLNESDFIKIMDYYVKGSTSYNYFQEDNINMYLPVASCQRNFFAGKDFIMGECQKNVASMACYSDSKCSTKVTCPQTFSATHLSCRIAPGSENSTTPAVGHNNTTTTTTPNSSSTLFAKGWGAKEYSIVVGSVLAFLLLLIMILRCCCRKKRPNVMANNNYHDDQYYETQVGTWDDKTYKVDRY